MVTVIPPAEAPFLNYYDGEWKNGKPDGKGVLYETNGT